jgi:hypothetical protein
MNCPSVIEPLVLVFDGLNDTTIRAVRQELTFRIAAFHINDKPIIVDWDFARVLVVQVYPRAPIVVRNIPLNLTQRLMPRAHLSCGFTFTERHVTKAWVEDAEPVADNMIPDDIIRVSSQIDAPMPVISTLPMDVAHGQMSLSLPRRANNHIVANRVSHLVAVFYVDSNPTVVPQHVGIDQAVVGTVQSDTRLERIYDGIPLESAEWAMTHKVEVEAVAPQLIQLSTIFNTGVTYVHNADFTACVGHHYRVKSLASGEEVVMVSCDQNGPLHVYHLDGHLVFVATYPRLSAEMCAPQGGSDRHFRAIQKLDGMFRRPILRGRIGPLHVFTARCDTNPMPDLPAHRVGVVG